MSEQSLGEPTDPNSDGFIHPVNSFFLDEDISHCLSVLEVREMFVEYRLKAGITIKIEVAGSQLGNAVAKFPPNLMTPKAQKNFVKYNELYELYRLSKATTSPRKTKSPRVSDHKSPRGAWSPRVSSDSIAKSPRVLSLSSELRYSRERLEGSAGSRNAAITKIDPVQPLSPNFTLKIPNFNQPPDPNQPRIEPSNSTTSPRGIQPSSPRNQFSPSGNPVSPRSNELYRSPKSPRVNNNPPPRQTVSPRTTPNPGQQQLPPPSSSHHQQQIIEPSPLSRSTEGLPHSPRSTPIGEFNLPPLSRSSEITRSDVPFLLSRTTEIHRSPRGVSSPNDPQVQPKSPRSNDHPQPISPRSPRSTPTNPSSSITPNNLDPVVQIQQRSPRSSLMMNDQSLVSSKSPRGVGVVGQQPQQQINIDVLSLSPRTTTSLNEGLSPRRLVTSPGSKEKSHSLDEQNKALNELENS